MIPEELKQKPNWVAYTWPAKVPINPATGYAARSNDPTTWGTYDQAQKLAIENDLGGVGFMFDTGYVGLDLDDCVTDGNINAYAKDVLRRCQSYAEFSPSGTGIHIIAKGQIPRAIKTKVLEVYSQERYFTVSGKVIPPYYAIRSVDLSWLFPSSTTIDTSKKSPLLGINTDIVEGNRNNEFTRIAGSLRHKGYTADEIYELLKAKAKEVNFSETELRTVCNSVGRYPTGVIQHGEASLEETGQASSIEEFLKEQKAVEWLVPGMIAANTIGFVVGLPESRKTWLLIDLAVEAARGGIWLEKFPVKKSKVLFVDQERFKGETQRRFRSVLAAKNLSASSLISNLLIKCGTSTRLNLQPSFDAFRKEINETRPDLVIIDSFATIHTANENSRQDIQDVLERVKQLRNEFGCTFLFIAHENKFAYATGKDAQEPSVAQMAGSVAVPAAAELVLTVRKQDSDSSMVFNTKNTMSSTVAPFSVSVKDKTDDKSQIEVKAF